MDIHPMGLVMPHSCTLNFATSLKTTVSLEEISGDVEIDSLDYKVKKTFKASDFTEEAFYKNHFGAFSLLAHILNYFGIREGVRILIQSESPPGAGLGGSTTMGIVLYKLLCGFTEKKLDRKKAIQSIFNMESCILSTPTGTQDAYPALYGGVLRLRPLMEGMKVEQLYNPRLAKFIKESLTLVYSGESRSSGTTNWEICKNFFNGNKKTKEHLHRIACLSHQGFEAIKEKKYEKLPLLIGRDGEERKELFSGIVTDIMSQTLSSLKDKVSYVGMKPCGAGGGGHFILVHGPQDASLVEEIITTSGLKKIPFSVSPPL